MNPRGVVVELESQFRRQMRGSHRRIEVVVSVVRGHTKRPG
jgi:hypothetical protein